MPCDNFLYGFKGAPPARHARARPAQRDRGLKPRSSGDECVEECERDHLVLSGEWRGSVARPGRRSVAPYRAGALWARPPTPGGWPRFPDYVVARRYAVSGTALSLIGAGGPSNGAEDSFTVQDHSQGRACSASVLRTADP